MARRAFFPTLPPQPPASTGATPQGMPVAARSNVPPAPPTPRNGAPPSSARGGLAPPSGRGSIPPPSVGRGSVLPPSDGRIPVGTGVETVPLAAVTQLLDRLAAADDAAFLVQWTEQLVASRARLEPALSVRLLRAYRETGRHDRARDLAASLPSAPSSWNPLDAARLAVERSFLAIAEGRTDHAEAELRQATRAVGLAPRGTGLREQLDTHVATAQLELRLGRVSTAQEALRLAEHVAERIEDGAWRVTVGMSLGHLAMRIADPRTAARHYASALHRTTARSASAMRAHGNLAIALASVGQFEEARRSAVLACEIAAEIAAGFRHADACDVLAIVEIAADRPQAALQALDDAHAALGDVEQPVLRYQLAAHRTLALAMLGRAALAAQWLVRADKLYAELGQALDPVDEQELVATRARTVEAGGDLQDALDLALPRALVLPDAFVTGTLNLVVARCAHAVGDEATARAAIERAALSGERHGWIYPDRQTSAELWQLALRSGDSRVVRYAEKITGILATGALLPSIPPPPASMPPPSVYPSMPPSSRMPSLRASAPSMGLAALAAQTLGIEPAEIGILPDGETLIYVTTPNGVTRVRSTELTTATGGATLVVDTIAHALRIEGREISLERRRALEPLVVQLLRRAREGLSAEEILRAAGGPGPESADAEHRVRVLISRVRDLLGDPSAIERVRDAGEHGKTRYRLAPSIKFALVEPLYNG